MLRGLVYYGEQFVEVPDETITLKDICNSFGISGDLTGVCVRNRGSARVVATLPFESLPAIESLRGDEENIYDLCTPAGHSSSNNNNNNNNNYHSTTADGDHNNNNENNNNNGEGTPTTDDMTEILRQLVQLGAASLLTSASGAQTSFESYDPRTSPGLLLRTIYPPSIYSPYRPSGDPLHYSHSNNDPISLGRTNTNTNTTTIITKSLSGPSYLSAVEPYVVEEATEALLQQRPDLIPQTEEEAQDILQGLMAAATQAKAMMAMADVEEEQRGPVDVKPNIQQIGI